jgi:hypothetical protein
MRTRTLAATGAAVALLAAPTMATAAGPPAEPGAGHASAQGQARRSDAPGAERRPAARTPAPSGTQAGTQDATVPSDQQGTTSAGSQAAPGPDASKAKKAKAYGKYCKGFSKKHVDGKKGTAFSRCVTAMAKLGSGETSNPRRACKGFSKKHVEGEKGTPFSRCVRAAAKLRAAKRRSDPSRYTDPFDRD